MTTTNSEQEQHKLKLAGPIAQLADFIPNEDKPTLTWTKEERKLYS